MANLIVSEKRTLNRQMRKRSGRPIRLAEVLIDGISANAAREGEMVQMWQRLAVTSDDPNFHSFVEGLDAVLAVNKIGGEGPRLSSTNHALIVIHADNSADVWVDNLAISIQALVLRDVRKGEAVYLQDIGDIRGVKVGGVKFCPDDKIFFLFRDAWRFGFYMNTSKKFDVDEMSLALAMLYRKMRYAHLYDAISNQPLFDRIVSEGWFPFAEIIGGEFRKLLEYARAGWPLDSANDLVLAAFDENRLDRMLTRWMARPHFAAKRPLLEEAIKAFKEHRPVSVLKIVLTEIEGILADAHKAERGKRAKLPALLQFAKEAAVRRSGAPDSLLLPDAFGLYLSGYTFRNFNPETEDGTAGSRHAVGHGAAESTSYTQARALQAILTLDQLALAT